MKKQVLTLMLATLLPLGLMAQGNITEPGASEPNQLYTTTYDNPGGPNHAPGGPNRIGDGPYDPGQGPAEGSPVGAPWALLAFAAAYGVARVLRRKRE